MILTEPGEVIVWGNGCEAAPSTTFAITPIAGGWWIEITIRGVQLYDRGAPANSATAPLALEDARASELLSALVDDAGSRRRQHARPTTDRDFWTTGIGLVHMRLTVDAVPLDRPVTNGLPDIADLLLALVQEAGLPFHDRLHPFPVDMR